VWLAVAKTETFLGVHSAATVSYAIKASKSADSGDRQLAAVMFSDIETPEATAALKKLARDPDKEVASLAQAYLSGPSDTDYYGISSQDVEFRHLRTP
jgi:HEAT repeat protein